MKSLRPCLYVCVAFATLAASAQKSQYFKNHGASLSAGITEEFSTPLNSSPRTVNATAPFGPSGTYAVAVANQQQYTTNAAGLVTSLQFYPVSWAGLELNYGYTHYQERYAFNYTNTSTPTSLQQVRIPVDAHEATAAYLFHARHLPLQPFFGVGGGAIDFNPSRPVATNQWRGAGLIEMGFDVPVHWTHVGFRVEGRSLFYRSPNFYQSAISTRSWRATAEPVASVFYRF